MDGARRDDRRSGGGGPLDERLRSANAAQTTAFRQGAALLPAPPQVVAIPFEGTTLPGYHFRAAAAGPRPAVILLGGYDGTVEELYIEALCDYSLAGHAERINCPTFVCNGEADDISASAPKLAAALRCPHEFRTFTAAEGAGDHCEAGARTLFHARAFDWLDGVLSRDRYKSDISPIG